MQIGLRSPWAPGHNVNPADRCHELAFILRKSQMKAPFVGPKVKFYKSPPHSVANEYLNAVVESIHHEDLAALNSNTERAVELPISRAERAALPEERASPIEYLHTIAQARRKILPLAP